MTTAVSNAVAPSDDRPLVAAVKKQAKRLLRLAKKSPLEISALSQALEVASQMHGYPSWQALSASNGKSAASRATSPGEAETVALKNKLYSTDDAEYLKRLADAARRWSRHPKASVNIVTPHFKALKQMPGMEGVLFVSVEDLRGINLIASPRGSWGMLPKHQRLFGKLVASLVSERCVESAVDSVIGMAQKKGDPLGGMTMKEKEALGGTNPIPSLSMKNFCGLGLEDRQDGKPSLREEYGREIFSAIDGVFYKFSKPNILELPANGVIVFELDPFNVDWELSPEHQWLLAAYLGCVRRMPSAVTKEYRDLPKKSFSIRNQDIAWIRSIDVTVREQVLSSYEEQTPDFVLDVWDCFEGPALSQWVREMSGQIFDLVNEFKAPSTQVATWVGYQPEAGNLPYNVERTRVVEMIWEQTRDGVEGH